MQLLAEHEQFAKVCLVSIDTIFLFHFGIKFQFRIMKLLFVEHKMLAIDLLQVDIMQPVQSKLK